MDRSCEWLALPGGAIRPVITVGDELIAWAAYDPRPKCSCGRPRLGSGRTCGAMECIARLTADG
jgi:hypothetical protein